ncbi:hypothetical protein GDO86_001458 [Hymenochirus boettgeri]|uniref:Riboflavin kinase n=1 Tax=Hymenochirus boettgeri TaxID=247094 RepID=A0A8T2KFU2_9PIPI|nr:hypothetical protein GDO86_001458 [Hymenochirus boettgeri]
MPERIAYTGRQCSGSAAGGGSGAAVEIAVPGLVSIGPPSERFRSLHLPTSPVQGEPSRAAETELLRTGTSVGRLPVLEKEVVGSCAMDTLPFFCRGEVVKGFGRGSKELGIPTANFPEHVVDSLPTDLNTGIYYGWGRVGNGEIYKMVMSIGWNPFYKNTKKSMETHIIHQFDKDFYGEILSIVIAGYIRPEKSFDSLDALIAAIYSDIEEAKKQLELPEFQDLKDQFFCTLSNNILNGH